jgi:branched-chain amino acid transport system substrate-binding protein
MLDALEQVQNYEDPFGGPTLSFSETKHQGSDYLFLSQIVDGKWVILEKNIPY